MHWYIRIIGNNESESNFHIYNATRSPRLVHQSFHLRYKLIWLNVGVRFNSDLGHPILTTRITLILKIMQWLTQLKCF